MASFFKLFTKKKPDPPIPIQSPLGRELSDKSAEEPLDGDQSDESAEEPPKLCVCKPRKINESSFKTLSNIDSKADESLICGDFENGNSGIKVCLPRFESDYQIDTSTTVALTMYTKQYTGRTSEKKQMSFEDIMGEIEMLHEFKDITPELKGVFFIQDPDNKESDTPETITSETSEHKISGYAGAINNNIFIAGSDILNMQDAIREIKDKIQIVVLLMEKCNTDYDIEDAGGILSLINSIVDKGFIGVDFKENNICGRINGEGKLLLIDTDKSMHLKINEDQKEIAKQYMILLFIAELYKTWLMHEKHQRTESPDAKRFYKILEIMVRSYVTSYAVNFEKLNDHFKALLTNIGPITSVLPRRIPIVRLIFHMPLLPDTLKYQTYADIIRAIEGGKLSPDDIFTKKLTIANTARTNLYYMFNDFNNLFFKKKGGKTRRKRNKSKSKRKTKTKR